MEDQSAPARSTQDDLRAQVLGADFSRLSAVEFGARRGIGPLSDLAKQVWHGQSRPCVSCGQLMRRTSERCDHCGQLHSGAMVRKMRLYSGPWYVHEHIRPFPGVSKERLLLQIQRGVLTATTIIRGPSTHHQWRYAAETPGISKHLGVCWACQAGVSADDATCATCRKSLDSDGEEALIEADETQSSAPKELEDLREAVRSTAPRRRVADEPARIGKVPAVWVVGALVVMLMAAVYLIARARTSARTHGDGTAGRDAAPLVLPDAAGSAGDSAASRTPRAPDRAN